MSKISRLDYYVGNYSRQPCLYDSNGKNVTAYCFKQLKKKAPFLLRYFVVRFDESGKEEINAEIPRAFEGHILNQIRYSIND